MNRLTATALTALLIAGGSATAALATPGDNGTNTGGLCTAYFNGSENGRAHKRQAPPFRTLEEQALEQYRENHDGEDPEYIEQAVAEYCGVQFDEDGNVVDDGLVNGNPSYDETPEPSKGGNPGKDHAGGNR